MNSERSVSRAQGQSPAASQTVASHSKCYIAPSPMVTVMFDQLEYLLAHGAAHASRGQNCTPECMDCARLQQVRNWLLLPFHSATHPPVH